MSNTAKCGGVDRRNPAELFTATFQCDRRGPSRAHHL